MEPAIHFSPLDPLPPLPPSYRMLSIRPEYDPEGQDHRVEFYQYGVLVLTTRATATGIRATGDDPPPSVVAWAEAAHRRIGDALATLPREKRVAATGRSVLNEALVRRAMGDGRDGDLSAAIGAECFIATPLDATLAADLRRYLSSPIRWRRPSRMSRQAWASKRQEVTRRLAPEVARAERFMAAELGRIVQGSEPVRADVALEALRETLIEGLAARHEASRRFNNPSVREQFLRADRYPRSTPYGIATVFDEAPAPAPRLLSAHLLAAPRHQNGPRA